MLISILSLQLLDKFNSRRFLKIINTFIIICLVGVFLKQGQRVYKYHEERNLIPNDRLLHTKYKEKIEKINISKKFYYYKSYSECKYFKSPCTHITLDKLYHKKIGSYDIILRRF